MSGPNRSPAGRDWLKIVLVEIAALLAAAFIWLLWQLLVPISHTVVLFLLGAALAFVLADPSDWLAHRIRANRTLGILITYLIVFVVAIGGILLLAVSFARQATELVNALPGRMADIQTALQARGIQLDLENIRSHASNSVVGSADVVLGSLVGQAAAIGGALTDAILVLVISVYLLAGAPTIQQDTLRACTLSGRARVRTDKRRTSHGRLSNGRRRVMT